MEEWTISGTRLEAYSGPGGDVKIPDGVTEAGKVNWNCQSGITALTFPGTLRKIPDRFCLGMRSLKRITLEEGVEEIGESAFQCRHFQSVSLPETLKEIRAGAFMKTWLTELTVPEGISAIRSCTFQDCHRLETVRLPASLKLIGNDAFSGSGLTELILPEKVESIQDQAFYDCVALTDLRFPASLRSIGSFAFFHTSLTEITLPEGLQVLSDYAFFLCGLLRQVHLPGSLKALGNWSFSKTGLIDLTLPEGLEEIGSLAFAECPDLRTVRFPQTLRIIGDNAFCFCPRLESVILAGTDMTIGSGAFSETSLTELTVPEGVTVIETAAFHKVPLRALRLPASLRIIGNRAFEDTALTEVTVPEGVEGLGEHCFSCCKNLRSLRLPASLSNLGTLTDSPLLSEVVFSAIPKRMRPITLSKAARIVLLSPADPDNLNHLLGNLRLPEGSELIADRVSLENLPSDVLLLLFRGWNTRLQQGESIPEELRPALLKAIRKYRAKLWRSGLLRQFMLEEGLLTLQNVRSFLESAQKEHDVELTAQLLEYQNRHFPPEEVARREQARIRRATAGLTLPEEPESNAP